MNLELMKQICKYNKRTLQTLLTKYLFDNGYEKVFKAKDGTFIFAEGTLPICLIAHVDTVFKHQPQEKDFLYDPKKRVLWSPYGTGFDDRAGIYAIIQIIKSGFKPSVIFTDGEEEGCVGSKALVKQLPDCPFKECNALIQLDRANHKDSVYYDCDNKDFESFINSYGFETDYGTYTDISILGPAWKIAAVNLSIGYLDEHTGSERLVCEWCDETIGKVESLLIDVINKGMNFYEFIPFKHTKLFEENNCLICNKKLDNTAIAISDVNSISYKICSSCYNKYYK